MKVFKSSKTIIRHNLYSLRKFSESKKRFNLILEFLIREKVTKYRNVLAIIFFFFVHPLHILCGSYLAVTRKRFHAFAVSLLPVFPEVSNTPLHRPSSLSSLSSFPLVRHRWKTLKIRVISGGREETPFFSSTVSSSRSNRRRRRRLLRLSIEAFRTWTGYMVDFPGVLHSRYRVATTDSSEPSPLTVPSTGRTGLEMCWPPASV